jgi:hypothetical protein
MNQSTTSKSKSNWDETREYFKEKTIAFKELKKRKQIETMKKELEKELESKKYNEKLNE